MNEARYGWQSKLPRFIDTESTEIMQALEQFVPNPSESQLGSWKSSVNWLKREYEHCIREDAAAYNYSTILEYELPRDLRRPDVIVLQNGVVIVLEVKGRTGASQAARDQVGAYARDLAAYHSACASVPVIPLLVPTDGPASAKLIDGVWVVGPEGVHDFLLRLKNEYPNIGVDPIAFLREDAYSPLPTIVQAARQLFLQQPLPRIKRARAATEPAIGAITEIAHEAAKNKSRHLVLLSGVPGAGKTLVGLQVVHAGWLDSLSVERQTGRPSLPAVYLSGNGPLVQVLQDALKGEESDGRVFVQAIKNYISYYSRKPNSIPPEHLVVFDEAQRAHDAARVAKVHGKEIAESEPEHLIEICNRIPNWSVLVALIGSGQAIHVGEEGGVALWRQALEKACSDQNWTVHGAAKFKPEMENANFDVRWNESLNLDNEIRFHLTPKVHLYVESLLEDTSTITLSEIADELWSNGHRFLITRTLQAAKNYLIERYEDASEARYGILASSKDKDLEKYGVDNTFQTTKRLKVGPWFNRPKDDELSCCRLETVATEFSSQGLELDFALLGWGTDLLWDQNAWSMKGSRGTRDRVENPMQLRRNVYRVLLTRGRDGTIVFVPPSPKFDSTYMHLVQAGFRELV